MNGPARPAPCLRRRLLHCAAAATAATLGLPRAVRAQRPPALVVWFTDEGSKGVRALGDRFTEETGVPLVVETPDPQEITSRFQQSAAAGKGPDLLVFAHDRLVRQGVMPVGSKLFVQERKFRRGDFATAAILSGASITAVFLLALRWMISGLAAGGVKG